MERTINFNQRSGFSGTGLPGANKIKENIYKKKPFGFDRQRAGEARTNLDLVGNIKNRMDGAKRNSDRVTYDMQALTRYPGNGNRLDINDSAKVEIKLPKKKPAAKLISDSSELRSHAGETTLGIA